ncbi:UNVERIFIED_CONTAM: hypothetical protein FKN15_014956 [Acipenser sinensis]
MSSTQDAPSFFKNMGSGSPKPRQKFCGMFCPVEGSTDNKTLDFGSLTAGRGGDVAGARNTNRVIAQQRDISTLDRGRKVEIRSGSGKEALQNLNDQEQQEDSTCRSLKEREQRKIRWCTETPAETRAGGDRKARYNKNHVIMGALRFPLGTQTVRYPCHGKSVGVAMILLRMSVGIFYLRNCNR